MLNVPDEQANTINQTKQDLTLQIIRNNANILNEKIQLHEWLKQNNIKIACVTNSIRQTAIEMLKKTGQIDYMDVLIANEDVIRNKPYPDCYNLAIEKLNVNPKYSLCVEDSDKGIKAATDSVVKHLLIVKNTHDVNLNNIKRKVEQI
jgi:HAD superfamily hydrolase (TIGR01509 family)